MTIAHPLVETRRPLVRRLVVSLIAALSLILGPLAVAPAHAADGAVISGTAFGEGGVSLEASAVDLIVVEGPEGYYAEAAYIDASGNYSISGVPDGTYRVRAYGKDNFVLTTSAPFTIHGGAQKTVDAITLPLGGSISGDVRGTLSGEPVSGAIVLAHPAGVENAEPYGGYATGGSFTLNAIPAGDYVVEFRDNFGEHVSEYYDNAKDAEHAQTVTVVKGGDTSLANAVALDEGAHLTGSVVDSSGDPVSYANVTVLPVVDGQADQDVSTYYSTDEFGAFDVSPLPAGDYQVRIGADGYFDAYAGGQQTARVASVTTVTVGQTVSVGTTVLERATSIAGTVINTDGESLDDVYVNAYAVVDGVVGTDIVRQRVTEDGGHFELPGLHAGTYRLEFSDSEGAYENRFDTDVTVAEGEVREIAPIVLALAPVVPPVVQPEPTPYTPPAVPAPVAKKKATVQVSAKGAKKKATLTISVKASGVTPTGKVTIKLGSKTLKTVSLKGGKAKVTLTKQKKGKRTYKVVYSGDSKVLGRTVSTSTVKIT